MSALLIVVACSGSENTPTRGAQSEAAGAGDKTGDDGKPGSPRGGSSSGDPEVAQALDVVFNEVASVGASEWIEIANKGGRTVDLGDHYIADSDKDTGEPKRKDAMRFPAGTMMAPGDRLLIIASKKNGTVGPHPKADCLPDGPESCYFASFGVSATSGEALHLLLPDGSVVTSTAFPKGLSADAGGKTTETRCRIPDLTGEFATCAPTPGAANEAP